QAYDRLSHHGLFIGDSSDYKPQGGMFLLAPLSIFITPDSLVGWLLSRDKSYCGCFEDGKQFYNSRRFIEDNAFKKSDKGVGK
ncbi:MAG TPA: hypothetical protein PLN25_11910, partial [Deltaproteobacteria bacterium]|nr:hypothetical protein [Deltaproteobacteria bacterium]